MDDDARWASPWWLLVVPLHIAILIATWRDHGLPNGDCQNSAAAGADWRSAQLPAIAVCGG
jgi:hypothetical protein